MPRATFVDEKTGEQVTVDLVVFTRRLNEPDHLKPHPHRNGAPMRLIQIDYQSEKV